MNGTNSLKDYLLIVQHAFPRAEKVFNVGIENMIIHQPNTSSSLNINHFNEYAVSLKGRVKFKLEDIDSYKATGGDINFMLQQAVHEKLRFNTYFDTVSNMNINLEKQTITVNFNIAINSTVQLDQFVKEMLYEIVDNALLG